MVETILSNPFVKELLLPFLLVFAIVFAVLQKAEIFGKGKKQSDAIIALVIGLIVVSVGYATDLINNLLPVLAVGLVVLLSFFLLWGFAFKEGTFDVHNSVKWVIAVVSAVVLIVAILYFTPAWAYIKTLISGNGSNVILNVVFVILIVGAILTVIFSGKDNSSTASSSD